MTYNYTHRNVNNYIQSRTISARTCICYSNISLFVLHLHWDQPHSRLTVNKMYFLYFLFTSAVVTFFFIFSRQLSSFHSTFNHQDTHLSLPHLFPWHYLTSFLFYIHYLDAQFPLLLPLILTNDTHMYIDLRYALLFKPTHSQIQILYRHSATSTHDLHHFPTSIPNTTNYTRKASTDLSLNPTAHTERSHLAHINTHIPQSQTLSNS